MKIFEDIHIAAAILGFPEEVQRDEVEVACTKGCYCERSLEFVARRAGLARGKKNFLFFLLRVSRASRHTLQDTTPMRPIVQAKGSGN